MYGCIVGKDADGIWLLAYGQYQSLEAVLNIYKQLNESMDTRLFNMDKETVDEIKTNLVEVENKFSGLFI